MLGSEGDSTYNNLGVRIDQGALSVFNPLVYGWQNTAVGLSVVTNTTNGIAQVMGGMGGGPGAVATYASRDKVAAYIGTMNILPWIGSVASFTQNSVVFSSPVNTTNLRVNMLVDTTDEPKFTGAITGWSSDGTTINVSGWFQMGNTAAGQVPRGTTVHINPVTKLWSLNSNVDMWQGGEASAATGYELGINNHTGADDTADLLWGMDVVNLGGNRVGSGYLARGELLDAYSAYSGSDAGFLYQPADTVGTALLSRAASGALFKASPPGAGTTVIADTASGALDLGAFGVAGSTSSPAIRFHTTGGANVDDAMIMPSGGVSGTSGQASLTYTAGSDVFAVGNAGQSIVLASDGTGAVQVAASVGQSLVLSAGTGGVVAAQSGFIVNAPQVEIGAPNAPIGTAPYIDWHFSVGTPQDYNVRLVNDADGQLSIYTASGFKIGQFNSAGLTVPSLISVTPSTPASSNAACAQGQQAWDSSYIYVCVAANSWKRAPLAAW